MDNAILVKESIFKPAKAKHTLGTNELATKRISDSFTQLEEIAFKNQ